MLTLMYNMKISTHGRVVSRMSQYHLSFSRIQGHPLVSPQSLSALVSHV